MADLLAMAAQFVTFLFVDFDGAGTETIGLVPKVAETILDSPILVIPIGITLVGLGVGMFGRLLSSARG